MPHINKKKILHSMLIICISVIFEIILSPIRGYIGMDYSTLLGFVAYFMLTVFLVKRFGQYFTSHGIFLRIAAGYMILQLPSEILHFESSLISLPDVVFHFLGIVAGYLYLVLHGWMKWTIVSSMLAGAFFMWGGGYSLWLDKLNFGTFTGKVDLPVNCAIRAIDKGGQSIQNSDFADKILLLDFWHSKCWFCFKEFPTLQDVYNQYKNDSRVSIYALNRPLQEDSIGQAFSIISGYKFTFPVLVATDDTLFRELGVDVYPTCLIIQKGRVIYKGDVKKAGVLIGELLSGR